MQHFNQITTVGEGVTTFPALNVSSGWAIGKGGNENRKWKMENGNGQNLMQMNAGVKPLINDHLLRPPLYKDRIIIMSQR